MAALHRSRQRRPSPALRSYDDLRLRHQSAVGLLGLRRGDRGLLSSCNGSASTTHVTAVKCSPIIVTIGHSTRTLDEFIALLKAHAVTLVVDVRTIPRSRHNPQFNENSLPDSLKKAGIGYVHMPGLGGLRHAKHDSLNTGWRNASFRGYADYMQTPEFEKQIEELIQLAKEHRIALMCAEAVPWRCHRSLIGDALTVRGIRTEDIMSLKLRRLHTLTPFAHVRGSTVTYPAENSSRPKKRTSTGKKERTPRTQ